MGFELLPSQDRSTNSVISIVENIIRYAINIYSPSFLSFLSKIIIVTQTATKEIIIAIVNHKATFIFSGVTGFRIALPIMMIDPSISWM
jgi:hypothetical protein